MTQLADALRRHGFESTEEKARRMRQERARLKRERDRAVQSALNPRDSNGKFRSVKADRERVAKISARLRGLQLP